MFMKKWYMTLEKGYMTGTMGLGPWDIGPTRVIFHIYSLHIPCKLSINSLQIAYMFLKYSQYIPHIFCLKNIVRACSAYLIC